ncbi:MAG: 30S ribosome-binding factor RbfA [Christensenellaceae bacterium]|jgi:ribosome-binding factor A|nr:30S ribosome-binding factor RbfA [Christensenellaceae bacterium]
MGSFSHDRTNSEIYRAFCIALTTRTNNPTLCGATVTRTELSNDSGSLRVFLSINGNEDEQKKVLDAFNKSSGFFRGEIAKNVSLRIVPKLSFIIDKGNENADKVEELLRKINGVNNYGGNNL